MPCSYDKTFLVADRLCKAKRW